MSDTNRSYRIRTQAGTSDGELNVKLDRNVDILEILSLQINQGDLYKLHNSNYGCIVGRVLANGGVGVPNVKLSIFIPIDSNDKLISEISSIYPFTGINSKNENGTRYNLLPNDTYDDCYRAVGTFPLKRAVLDDERVLEVYEKYYKYTTSTNKAGDYMFFGVPTGNCEVHLDLDLSDCGILSQKPRDLLYKGYNITQFDNPNQFKKDTNIDNLTQIISQNFSVFVYPFWGDSDQSQIAISRKDVQITYKFEPTCVFMGAVFTDNGANAIGDKCNMSTGVGDLKRLRAGEGTIEMIRQTNDGLIEQVQIQGDELIDSDGVFCYQIPMNLDYVTTDEYGNLTPTDNPNNGIPTRTRVRFRFSINEMDDEAVGRHTAKYLVPNNLSLVEGQINLSDVKDFENCFNFGSNTPDNFFKDLYWNKVYSVKNYIPRIQLGNNAANTKFLAVKTTNSTNNTTVNPMPYNKLRIHTNVSYRIICIIYSVLLNFTSLINDIISTCLLCINIFGWKIQLRICRIIGARCITITFFDENYVVSPTCKYDKCVGKHEPGMRVITSVEEAKDLMEQDLGADYDVVSLDFGADWINGSMYMPLWFWKKTKKKKYLFGLFTKKGVNRFCKCDVKNNLYRKLGTVFGCPVTYESINRSQYKPKNPSEKDPVKELEVKSLPTGLIKEVENMNGVNIYYYTPGTPTESNYDIVDKPSYVRLFSTDIILLGSFNDCDLDGVPQLFLDLPNTTFNDVDYRYTPEMSDDNLSEIGLLQSGYDWLATTQNVDKKQQNTDFSISYNKGLYADLGCTNIITLPKSCINAERMCELDVSPDTKYYRTIPSNNGFKDGKLVKVDGLITRYELDGTNNRAIFATLNHNSLNNKKIDQRTGFPSTSFSFLYPIDFDGRFSDIGPDYSKYESKNGNLTSYDAKSDDYLTFRFGTTGSSFRQYTNKFPLFENSFYFYFGYKPGSSALDKFKKLYFSECGKDTKYSFSMNISSTASHWCYPDPKKPEATITISLDNIATPYSLSIKNSLNETVLNMSGLYETSVIVGSGSPLPDIYLSNGEYNVTVTDANDKSITQKVQITQKVITLNYRVSSLGTRFYDNDEEQTKKEDICNQSLYGQIRLDSVNIDGIDHTITSLKPDSATTNQYILTLKDGDEAYGTAKAYLLVTPSDTASNPNETFCDNLCTVSGKCDVFDEPVFNIWRPQNYTLKITQSCNGALSRDNFSTSVATVTDSEALNATYNDMPIKFIYGTSGVKNPMFYKQSKILTSPSELSGWFGLMDEKTYKFPPVDSANTENWNTFMSVGDLTTEDGKVGVMSQKLQWMLNLSNRSYVVTDKDSYYTTVGGRSPILYRSSYPYWEEGKMKWISNNISSQEFNANYPYIVADNYAPVDRNKYNYSYPVSVKGVRFNGNNGNNGVLTSSGDTGWYIAAFDNNGSITMDSGGVCTTDSEVIPLSVPNGAILNPNMTGKTSYCPNYEDEKNTFADNSYFRAMNVDRRLDYVVNMYTAYYGPSFDFLNTGGTGWSGWVNPVINGQLYNGIEVSCDRTGNIVGSDLELTADNSTGILTFNQDPSTPRKYYAATVKSDGVTTDILSSITKVNGDFSVVNYPTRRSFDLKNTIPSGNKLTFSVTPFSYDQAEVSVDDNNIITAIVTAGTELTFDIDMRGKVTPKMMEGNDIDVICWGWSNNGPQGSKGVKTNTGYVYYNCCYLTIAFTVKPDEYNTGHRVRNYAPMFINVSKYDNNWAQIAGNNIYEIKQKPITTIKEIYANLYRFVGGNGNVQNIVSNYPNGSKYDKNSNSYLKGDGTPIFEGDTEDNDMVYITGSKKGLKVPGGNYLWMGTFYGVDPRMPVYNTALGCVAYAKEYYNNDGTTLTKQIRTVNLSNIYDFRAFYIPRNTTATTTVTTDVETTDDNGNPITEKLTITKLKFDIAFDGYSEFKNLASTNKPNVSLNQCFADGNFDITCNLHTGSQLVNANPPTEDDQEELTSNEYYSYKIMDDSGVCVGYHLAFNTSELLGSYVGQANEPIRWDMSGKKDKSYVFRVNLSASNGLKYAFVFNMMYRRKKGGFFFKGQDDAE
jgi:hypothetical protein